MGATAKVELLVIGMLLVALSHFLERDLRERGRAGGLPGPAAQIAGGGPSFVDLDEPGPLAAQPVATPARGAPAADEYEVRPGDTLSKIAKRMLGQSSRWQEIADANRDRLPRPADLKPGIRLRIPPRQAPARPASAPATSPAADAALAGRRSP